jgi:hypothetical protein
MTMRRFNLTYVLLTAISATFALGWTTQDPPTGDTTTVIRGDVIYADEGTTIQVYRAGSDGYELVRSIETDQAATHDVRDSRRRRHHDHSFSCTCTHTHDHGHRHPYEPYDPCDPCYEAVFAASGDELAYVYERTTVVILDVSTPDDPLEASRVDVGWEIEAIDVIDGSFVVVGSQGRRSLEVIAAR